MSLMSLFLSHFRLKIYNFREFRNPCQLKVILNLFIIENRTNFVYFVEITTREKFRNTEFYLIGIFPYFDQKKILLWKLSTQFQYCKTLVALLILGTHQS